MSSRVLAAALLAFIVVPACARAQDWQTMNSSRRAAGEEQLRVNLEYGAGTLGLKSGSRGTLYRTNLRYDANAFTPNVNFANDRLRIGMTGSSRGTRNVRTGELNVELSPDVPLELDLSFGAADANLDLGGLRVRSLQIQTGASRTTLRVPQLNRERCRSVDLQLGAARFEAIGLGNLNAERLSVQGGVGEIVLDFTGEWPANMHAKIEMGLGSLTLRVPNGLGVHVARSGVLASFDSQGLIKRGQDYYSEGWDRAARRLSLDLNAALGSIRVVWVDS